jgi:hypothetical protein
VKKKKRRARLLYGEARGPTQAKPRLDACVPALGRLFAIRRLCVLQTKRKNRGNQKEKLM